MIRAHLATFPPRRALAERVVDRIAPQVDRRCVVLNGYDAVPEAMARHPNVTAHIPDRDLKDAGKFRFAPEPSDLVFLIDDDIGYPPDYVARVVRLTRRLDLSSNVFGYHGHVLRAPEANGAPWRWRNYFFHKGLGRIRGVSLIGTGTLFALGANIAPLSVMESAAGFCDIRYGSWLYSRGVLPWVLPRPEGYLTSDLPHDLWESSLFRAAKRQDDPRHRLELASFGARWPHANVPFGRYASGVRAPVSDAGPRRIRLTAKPAAAPPEKEADPDRAPRQPAPPDAP